MVDAPVLPTPGLIVLFGSGETSPTGRKVFDQIFHSLPASPRLALLETPAGFEVNSPQVIGRVADFFSHRLQNYSPQVQIIPARKRGTPFSPDQPEIVEPLLQSDLIFMGPGSPSYAIRQLRDSLAWYYILARHWMGAVIALASAATIAFGALALPVYEIYKAGDELQWIEGLDFFKMYGLQLIFVPHWNNQEGGEGLDTSHCFMGQERFASLMQMLPQDMTIVGLDEKTALFIDPSRCICRVKGLGRVTLIHPRRNHAIEEMRSLIEKVESVAVENQGLAKITMEYPSFIRQYQNGEVFHVNEIGHFQPCNPEDSLPVSIWQKALRSAQRAGPKIPGMPPDDILQLVKERDSARKKGNWAVADRLRDQLFKLNWDIVDTKEGPVVKKLPNI
jgi:hypothetical protein